MTACSMLAMSVQPKSRRPTHTLNQVFAEPESSDSRPGAGTGDPALATRLEHIRASWHVLSGLYAPERVAALFGISVPELYRWKNWALGYDDPEAEGLRRAFPSAKAAPSARPCPVAARSSNPPKKTA